MFAACRYPAKTAQSGMQIYEHLDPSILLLMHPGVLWPDLSMRYMFDRRNLENPTVTLIQNVSQVQETSG